MRYLILAAVFLYITFTVGVAFAAQPKAGDIVETIYACKTETVLDMVLSQETVEDFNMAADAGIQSGDCMTAPGDAKVMSEVSRLLKVYTPKWANLNIYSFATESGGSTYYTFSYEPAQGV